MRAFRFAVTASGATTLEEWREKARRAEGLGFDVLLVTDHLGAQLAPVPALMAAADAASRLRVGSFVFSNDYRNPVMLAKEIATLDVLSGGRVELGIGAGWNTSDYHQLGIPYDPPAVRVARLIEAVTLIKRLLSEELVDHDGTHYHVRGVRLLPRPLQRPHPPLMIGGGGPRVLRLAAREANIVAFAPQVDSRGGPRPRSLTVGALAERIRALREEVGARYDALELNVIVFDAAVTDHSGSLVAAAAARLKALATTVVASPFFLYGSRSSLRDLLVERRETLGVSYIAIPDRAMDTFAPIVADLRAR